jgi:glucosylceramidase
VVTECTGTTDGWIGTFGWDSRVLVTESIRAGSTGLLMWNLALPPATATLPGGCGDCRGLLTIDPTTGAVTRNPEFFVLAHLADAADPGAVRVGTSEIDGLPTVAFANPDGTVGLFGHNDTDQSQVIEIARSDGIATTISVGPWELFSVRR